MFKIGQIVTFKTPAPNEQGEQFKVIEMRGPRVLVQVLNSGFSVGLEPTCVYLASDLVPDLQETIAQMKREVLAYIAQGRIPSTVSTFGELHDYIDANTLGGFCEDNGITDTLIELYGGRDENEGMPDEAMQYFNDAQDAVNAWIVAGGHKRPAFDATGLPLDLAKLATEKAAQMWCYASIDGQTFYVTEDQALKMQERSGGTVYPPL